MHANAPRSNAEPLDRGGGREYVAKAATDGRGRDVISDTRARLRELGGLDASREEITTLLSNGHLALALLRAGRAGIPAPTLRRAAQAYEAKGWDLLAANAYRACGDLEDVQRIAAAFAADGRAFDAADVLEPAHE